MRGRFFALVPIVAVSLALLGVASADAGSPTVRVGDNFFSKRSLTVRKGTVVRFVWVGHNRHNVTGGGRASKTTSKRGYVYKRRFTRSVTLICTVHPDQMRMRVRVR